ncbi:MAG TPA: ribokinase [Baekduia sp.]
MASVIVVGSVNVDLVVRLPRLPPPGETVTGGTFRQTPGGKGGNQAAAAARLGAATTLIARVGDDPHGRLARADLDAVGVDTTWMTATAGADTGVASILVDAAGENLIGVAPGANDALTAGDVRAAFAAQGQDGSAVVVASLEVPLEAVEQAAACARERGWPFVLNPAPARPLPAGLLRMTTVLTPNQHEVGRLGDARTPDDLLAAGVDAVVVTCGGDGVRLVTRQGHDAIPAHPVTPVDTTGAGDALTGALAWSLSRGDDLRTAVGIANAAAALSTRADGARGALPDSASLAAILP